MIQRIQSVYLFVAAALTFCLLGIPYASIGNLLMKFKVTACRLSPMLPGMKDATMLPLAVITLCAALLCVITIFLFKNRTRQMKTVRLNILFQVIVLVGMVAYAFGIKQSVGMGSSITPKFALILPIINIVLLILAYKGIKADDDLVKSADRLR